MLLPCVAGLRTAGALALFAPIECLEVPVRKEWRPNLGTARSTTPVSEVSHGTRCNRQAIGDRITASRPAVWAPPASVGVRDIGTVGRRRRGGLNRLQQPALLLQRAMARITRRHSVRASRRRVCAGKLPHGIRARRSE